MRRPLRRRDRSSHSAPGLDRPGLPPRRPDPPRRQDQQFALSRSLTKSPARTPPPRTSRQPRPFPAPSRHTPHAKRQTPDAARLPTFSPASLFEPSCLCVLRGQLTPHPAHSHGSRRFTQDASRDTQDATHNTPHAPAYPRLTSPFLNGNLQTDV